MILSQFYYKGLLSIRRTTSSRTFQKDATNLHLFFEIYNFLTQKILTQSQ